MPAFCIVGRVAGLFRMFFPELARQGAQNTPDTSATFTGVIGHTYSFYSLAVDSVGNAEQKQSVPDAWSKVLFHGDAKLTVADAVYLINYLFKEGPAPCPTLEAGDVNGDGKVTVSDVVYLVNYLFKGGPLPIC